MKGEWLAWPFGVAGRCGLPRGLVRLRKRPRRPLRSRMTPIGIAVVAVFARISLPGLVRLVVLGAVGALGASRRVVGCGMPGGSARLSPLWKGLIVVTMRLKGREARCLAWGEGEGILPFLGLGGAASGGWLFSVRSAPHAGALSVD